MVWVHLGTFRYCVKLGANWAELVQLMQKFVQRSRVGIFRNEGTRSILWILNSCSYVFRNVWGAFAPIRYCTKLGANPVQLVQKMQKFMQQSGVEIFRKEGTRSIPLYPSLMFWCVS